MYVEERTYLLHPGKAPEYFKHYEEVGMKVQLKHLLNLIGYYVIEASMQNLVTHMWAYDDLNQSDKMRAAMQADLEWQAYLPRIWPLIITQKTKIHKCAPFFVERLKKMLTAVK